MWIFKKLAGIFFPASCRLCGREGSSLCDTCTRSLSRNLEPLPEWIWSTYSYKDPSVKKCLHQAKYYHRKDLLLPLVKSSIDEDLRTFIDRDAVLVPIPMHWRRRLVRGYNHALLIAQAYSSTLNIPVHAKLLIRAVPRTQQAKLKQRKEREQNVRGSFSVNEKAKFPDSEQTIILVDDTTTTHATLAEARKTLEEAGFKKIKALTLAH